MPILIAAGHIVGALLALIVLGIGIQLIGVWDSERNQKIAVEECSLALGISIGDLDSAENLPKVVQFAAAKYSAELLRNRLSDLCGVINTGWGWLCLLLQVGVFLAVLWQTASTDLSASVHAWWVIAVLLLFWVTSVLFALVCKLLTGRYPGEAKQQRRKILAVAS